MATNEQHPEDNENQPTSDIETQRLIHEAEASASDSMIEQVEAHLRRTAEREEMIPVEKDTAFRLISQEDEVARQIANGEQPDDGPAPMRHQNQQMAPKSKSPQQFPKDKRFDMSAPTYEDMERAAQPAERDLAARTEEDTISKEAVEAGIDQLEAHLREAAKTSQVSDAETVNPKKYDVANGYDDKRLQEAKDQHLAGLAGALDNSSETPEGETSEHMAHIAGGELVNIAHQLQQRQPDQVAVDERGFVHLNETDIKEVASLLHGPLQEDGDDNLAQAISAANRFHTLAQQPGLSEAQRRFATEKALILEDVTKQLLTLAEQPVPEPGSEAAALAEKIAAEMPAQQYLRVTSVDVKQFGEHDGELTDAKRHRLDELAGTIKLLPHVNPDGSSNDDPNLLNHDADIDQLTADIIAITHEQDIRNEVAEMNKPVHAHQHDITVIYDQLAEDKPALDSLKVVYDRLRKDADSDADGERSPEEVEFNQSKVSILAAILARREAGETAA